MVDKYEYSVYRKDRFDKLGGGVCILVNNNAFSSSAVNLLDKHAHLELVAINICNLPFKCRLITVYRPPTYDTDISGCIYCQDLSDCVENLSCINCAVIICGDFNLPTYSSNVQSYKNFSCSSIMSDVFSKHAFVQYVSEPTRYNRPNSNHNASLLDLVLCNDSNLILNVNVNSPFSTSDHCVVQFDIMYNCNTNSYLRNESKCTRDFKRADWAGICRYLNNIDFLHDFMFYDSIVERFDYFYKVMYDCIDANVPLVGTSTRRKGAHYPVAIRRYLSRKKWPGEYTNAHAPSVPYNGTIEPLLHTALLYRILP